MSDVPVDPVEPEQGSVVDDDVVHDAVVELNQLRVAMRMDPVAPPRPPTSPGDGAGHDADADAG